MASKAKEIVEESRKKMVEALIARMESGELDWERGWSISALLPKNPVSGVTYNGGNRFRLMFDAFVNQYDDPRYMTYVQAQKKGWQVKRGATGRLCEKWVFEKMEEQINPDTGRKEKVIVKLKHPVVNYFYVYHASDIEGIPEYEGLSNDHSLDEMLEALIQASPCPVKEIMQTSAYYAPALDEIVMPPRHFFKSEADFIKTLAHEEVHATGAAGRLNRQILNEFGTPEYAKEELRAELGSLFLTSDLGLPSDGAVAENTAAYLQNWISVLKEDPDELFRAATDADKAVKMLKSNFEKAIKKNKELGTETLQFGESEEKILQFGESERENLQPGEFGAEILQPVEKSEESELIAGMCI